MTKPLPLTDAVRALNRKAELETLNILCSQDAAVARGDVPDILLCAFAAPAFDAGCMFLVPVAGRGAFTRAERLTLNGIPGFIGPAPNERLGVVDVMFTSDMRADEDPAYTGLHLFTDVLLDRELDVYCRSVERTEHRAVTRLSKMQFARMTVFDVPLDPEWGSLAEAALFPGARVRLNGADAIIAGNGARHVSGHPSLSVIGDLFPMRQDRLIRDSGGILEAHNLAFAVPLSAVSQPEPLMQRAFALASESAETARFPLKASEEELAADLRSGAFRLADPGPPSRTP